MADDKEMCGDHQARIGNVENAVEIHRVDIASLKARPPVWATVVISLLTFALGLSIRLQF